MGTKIAVAFANIFMAKIEREILRKSTTKPFNTRISFRVNHKASRKGEALRLLRTNSSQFTFEENMINFKTHLQNRDYPARIVEKHLSEIKFSDKL